MDLAIGEPGALLGESEGRKERLLSLQGDSVDYTGRVEVERGELAACSCACCCSFFTSTSS